MNYNDHQEYDKVMNDYLRKPIDFGLPFDIFVTVVLIALNGAALYLLFK